MAKKAKVEEVAQPAEPVVKQEESMPIKPQAIEAPLPKVKVYWNKKPLM